MSNDELRRMFETVLTAPPPDTGDIDAAIHSGRRRRHRRTAAILLSTAAAIAAIGVAATVLLPDSNRHPASPAATSTTTNAQTAKDEGTTVTSAQELLGAWWTTELDGQDVSAVRDRSDRPLGVTFQQYGGQLRWSANDIVNYHSGTFSVSAQGRFLANEESVTAVGTTGNGPQYLRNPQVVVRATQARIVAPTPTKPAKLLLLTGDKIVAVYTPAAR
jgi:hypothetical protein